MKTETIRRGRATDALFLRATEGYLVRRESGERGLSDPVAMPVDLIHRVFRSNKTARMTMRSDGVAVFVVPDSSGWSRYELR